jgi:hypothetical protein
MTRGMAVLTMVWSSEANSSTSMTPLMISLIRGSGRTRTVKVSFGPVERLLIQRR